MCLLEDHRQQTPSLVGKVFAMVVELVEREYKIVHTYNKTHQHSYTQNIVHNVFPNIIKNSFSMHSHNKSRDVILLFPIETYVVMFCSTVTSQRVSLTILVEDCNACNACLSLVR